MLDNDVGSADSFNYGGSHWAHKAVPQSDSQASDYDNYDDIPWMQLDLLGIDGA